MQQFLSDNNAGICPSALAMMVEANAAGHALGYGGDRWTLEAKSRIARLFERTLGEDCAVYFAFNGTAANALSLAHLLRPWNAVIAHAFSHIEMDEAGAVSFFSGGASLMTAETPDAKLTLEAVRRLAGKFDGVHHVRPSVLSLTQATELGTVYSLAEMRALSGFAHDHGFKVHLDGARFANAVASLGVSPADASWRSGIDIMTFGGVKNGLAVGEAIVVFDLKLADELDRRIKQAGHLNSKMRLAAAAWLGLLDDDVWLTNAQHANAMARRLADKIAGLPDVRVMHAVDANGVFVEMPEASQAALRAKGWEFYTFIPPRGCRLMCAWDTTAETVDTFAADLSEVTGALPGGA